MTQDLSRFPELHALETRILTRLSEDVPLRVILDDITLTVDRLMAEVRSSILLVENGVIRHGSAPNLPPAFNAAIDGEAIGENAGSCGSAAFLGKQVIVVDTLTDPLWHDYRELAIEHGLLACWSTPVLSIEDQVLATFAIYHKTARTPNQAEINFINRISHFVRVAVERAQHKQALQKSEEKLAQMQRLEALGQLTGGIAHDFNNLLTVIIGNSELLASTLPHNPRQQDMLKLILTAAGQGADLTSRLLTFASKQTLSPAVIDLFSIVKNLQPLVERTLGSDIRIQFRFGGDLWPVLIDPTQFESAVLNLCLNARDAMTHGGSLTVEAANVSFDYKEEMLAADIAAGDYVMLAISDTGSGMDEATISRAFEPFFSSKPAGTNSGMGLSMVYGFIRQSHGHVRLYSEPGQGTTVRMYLPRAMDKTADENPTTRYRPGTEPALVTGDAELILLVEDNELVRLHVEKLLHSLGYQTISAANGMEALGILAGNPSVDLLFTDVVMPGGMNGRELSEQALAIKPDLPVLFTSGYAQDAIMHQGRLARGDHLLPKPYRRMDLANKLREVLDNESPDSK
ncbi:MAG: ATP-binding protein [Pseudohongiella sp.]|nr:ATP-binding protein [Pseudohongiella sp.]